MSAINAYRAVLAPPLNTENSTDFCGCHFIPPHMEAKIKSATEDKVKRRAERNRGVDDELRALRHLPRKAKKSRRVTGFKVFDAKNIRVLPGVRIHSPSDSKDPSVTRAHEGAIRIYDYFLQNHGRNSINAKGMNINSTVHYGKKYDNAFWNSRQMVYGDGDKIIFDDFTVDYDVIAHELSHGVTEHSAGLIYQDQPGALNESMSDVFASTAKQYMATETVDKANWLIGDKVLLGPGALRSLKEPGRAYVENPYLGTDPQPYRMSAYDKTEEDSGGVHINSGIPNHAFYLTATAIEGASWDKPAKIWYTSLIQTKPEAQFVDFAKTTIQVSVTLYGEGSKESQAVRRAWETVEVFVR